MSKVSIIIPSYNRASLIAQTINSARNQTFEDIEIIVIDNASTDDTFEIALEISKLDSRLRLYRNEENIGPVRNWIKGIGYANSDIAKLLFSDDLLSPTYLEKCLPYLEDDRCGLVYTSAMIGKNDWVGTVYYDNYIGDSKIKASAYIHGQTLIEHLYPVSPCASLSRLKDLKNNIHLNLTGFEMDAYAATGAGVDWLFHPLTMLGYQYAQYVDSCEVFFRSHGDNLTGLAVIPECYVNAKQFFKLALNLKR